MNSGTGITTNELINNFGKYADSGDEELIQRLATSASLVFASTPHFWYQTKSHHIPGVGMTINVLVNDSGTTSVWNPSIYYNHGNKRASRHDRPV